MAHMVYSTLLTSTVRSERQECPPRLTSRHIYKCATHSVRAWPRVLWRERMGGRRTMLTHCEAPHWCVHPQVTEGWRGQPVRLEIRQRGVSWRSCWDSRWGKGAVRAAVTDIIKRLHDVLKQWGRTSHFLSNAVKQREKKDVQSPIIQQLHKSQLRTEEQSSETADTQLSFKRDVWKCFVFLIRLIQTLPN